MPGIYETLRPLTLINIAERVWEKGDSITTVDRFAYAVAFCKSGRRIYEIDGKEYVHDKNTVIFLPKGATYNLRCTEDGVFYIFSFTCPPDHAFSQIFVQHIQSPDWYWSRIEKIRNLFLFSPHSMKLMSLFYQLLSALSDESQRKDNIIAQSIAYMEENYSSPLLTNTLLAKKAKISEVYFRRLFIAKYGMTPKQYIIDIRIRLAKQLLSESDLSISQIAEQSGFSNVFQFCTSFKQKVGMTPTEYRNQNRLVV